MDDNSSQMGLYRSACAECHRRKQKCNRQWPCNHCQKRKVADKCRFVQASSPSDSAALPSEKKRARAKDDDEAEDADDSLGLEAMGYGAGPLFESLSIGVEKKKPLNELKWVDVDGCPQLQHVLSILPPRPQMDALVQSFFSNVNYHYYIIYPPTFLAEYQRWWERRAQGRPLAVQWTILLAVICACAAQHLDADTKPTIHVELGESPEKLTKEYHDAAQDLARVIPVGHCHILNIQWMLHSIYWYKAEARFVEAWHVISAAVREAYELGLHRVAAAEDLSEFDKEVRRRLWCILDCWDWQFASGLGRPTMIDHTDINVEPPRLTLEDLTPSPLLHMKLQAELITDLARRWSAPKNVSTPAEIQEYKRQIEDWISAFPPVYDTENPDTSMDGQNSYVTFHRFYIHTMAYLMILNPMRAHMAKVRTRSSPIEELELRADAVHYSLKNLNTTTRWASYASHRDGRFHFIIFSLFDTAAVLSTAVIKDEDLTIPRRDDIMIAVDNAVLLLRRLKTISKTAKTSYDILCRMVQRMPRRVPARDTDNNPKRQRTTPADAAPGPEVAPQVSGESSAGGGASYHSPSAHFYVAGPDSQSTSPSNFASPASVGAGSTPQSCCTSNEGHNQVQPPVQPAAPINQDLASMPVPQIAPTVGVDAMLQSGALFDGASMQGQHGVAAMVPPASAYADFQIPGHDASFGLENITDAELGDFSNLWDWRSLNLDFIQSSK